MFGTDGMGMVLVREIGGIPVDVALVFIAMGAMLGLMFLGSRPAIIAKYAKRPPEGADRETAPAPREGAER